MSDDPRKTGRQDDERVNVNQEHEVQYWSKKLGVTPQRLREAAKAAGPMVENIKRHLDS